MKRILFSIIAILSLVACSKEGDTSENYMTDYAIGSNYTQTFYVGNHAIWGSGGKIGTSYSFTSVCKRLHFDINPDSDIYEAVRPPQELYNAIVRKNNNQQKSEMKYYAIADMSFTYGPALSNIKRLSEWTTVIGKEEEYVFKGNIYKHLVIIEKVDLEY
jgi:hypothetical protein